MMLVLQNGLRQFLSTRVELTLLLARVEADAFNCIHAMILIKLNQQLFRPDNRQTHRFMARFIELIITLKIWSLQQATSIRVHCF